MLAHYRIKCRLLLLITPLILVACVAEETPPGGDGSSANLINGKTEYEARCALCHDDTSTPNLNGTGDQVGDIAKIIDETTGKFVCTEVNCNDPSALANYIDIQMPSNGPATCKGDCARDTAAFVATFEFTPSGSSSSSSSSSSASSSGSNPIPDANTRDLAVGADIYKNQCASCHGPTGREGPLGKLTPEACVNCRDYESLVKKIEATMPAPGKCTGNCAIDVGAYVYLTFGKADPGLNCENTGVKPGKSPMRRLNKREYTNTLVSLLGVEASIASAFPDETIERSKGFDTNNDLLGISESHVDAMSDIAKKVAVEAVKNIKTTGGGGGPVVPMGDQCNTTAECKTTFGNTATDCKNSQANDSFCMCGAARCDANQPPPPPPVPEEGALLSCANLDDTCAHNFIRDFGRKAFRRPITSQEQTSLRNSFAEGKKIDFAGGIQLVLEAILQSPAFIYRPEFGLASSANAGVVQLTSWEMASRLSYMFWSSEPDDTLLDLAAQDKLRDAAEIRRQAERLLTDDRAKSVVQSYYKQWLGITDTEQLVRDPAVYTGFTTNTPKQLLAETEAFIDNVFWGVGTLNELLTANYTYVNDDLATFYGFAKPGTNQYTRVSHPGHSYGILTQGSFLASRAREEETAPILRGAFMLENLLCVHISPPPPTSDIEVVFPDPNSNLTTRQRWEELTSVDTCNGCHRVLNPPGFVMEPYDSVGRLRTTENNIPIDTAATLVGTDIDGAYQDMGGLVSALAASDQVAHCSVTSWASYAYGRHIDEYGDDACSIDKASKGFITSGKDLKQLLVELTQTDAFMYRSEVK